MALFKRCTCEQKTKCRHPYHYVFELLGERYSRSTHTANRQTAGRVEERRRIAIVDGKDETPQAAYYLSDLVKDYTESAKEEQVTFEKSVNVMKHFSGVVGNPLVSEIGPFAINKWKLSRAKEVKQTTVNRELNVLRGMFSQAMAWKKLATHPMNEKISGQRAVENFTVDDARVRVLDDDELRLILKASNSAAVLMCRVTLISLNRISEVRMLHKSHLGPSWMEVRRKGGKVHRVALEDDLREQLVARCHAKSGYVFGAGSKGEPPTEQAASQCVVRALRSVGVLDASHHTMRHTGVTLMLEQGVNPRVIQLLAGWTSLRMLERYGHARDTEIRRAVNSNAAYLQAVTAKSTTDAADTKPTIAATS